MHGLQGHLLSATIVTAVWSDWSGGNVSWILLVAPTETTSLLIQTDLLELYKTNKFIDSETSV